MDGAEAKFVREDAKNVEKKNKKTDAATKSKKRTFFFSSTLIAFASLRKMALPQRRSLREVNW